MLKEVKVFVMSLERAEATRKALIQFNLEPEFLNNSIFCRAFK